MNMKKILLALGIGAGVGAACYFAKKKLDEMYYDMCAAPPYVPSPAGPAKRPAATAEKKPTPDAPAAEPVAEEEGAEPSAADGENLKERPAADAQETPAPERTSLVVHNDLLCRSCPAELSRTQHRLRSGAGPRPRLPAKRTHPPVFFVKKDPQITVSRMRTRCPA